jgi:hypothetical protein
MQQKDKTPLRVKPKTIIRIFLVITVFVVGGVIYGFIANQLVSAGISDIRSALIDLEDMKDDTTAQLEVAIGDLNAIATATAQLKVDIVLIQSRTSPTPGPAIDTSALDEVVSLMNDAAESIEEGIDSVDDIDVTEPNKYIKMGDMYRYWAQVGLLGFLLLPYIMVFLSILCNVKWLAWNVTWVGVLAALFAWLLTGIETVGNLILADVCVDPNDALLRQAAEIDEPKVLEYVQFLVICEGVDNPLQETIDDVLAKFAEALTNYGDFEDSIPQAYKDNMSPADQALLEHDESILGNATLALNTTVYTLVNTVFKCNRLHNNYVDTMNGICNKTFQGFFALMIIQGGIAFLMWITIYCGIKLYQYFQALEESGGGDIKTELKGLFHGGDVDLPPADNAYDPGIEMQKKDQVYAI